MDADRPKFSMTHTLARRTLLFVHGWAFGPDIWAPLQARLADWPQATVDMGYFGAARPPTLDGPCVVIGHSYGVARSLAQPFAGLAGFVSINGFARFCADDTLPEAVPTRVVERMLSRLDKDATAVVSDFRARCGAPPASGTLDTPALRRDLLALRDGDARTTLEGLEVPVLALAGTADPIVAPTSTQAQFGKCRHATLRWRNGGDHLLPLSAPDWCADALRHFLDDLA